MTEIPDCDIDVKGGDERDKVASIFREATVASQLNKRHLVKHNTSLHFQKIPVDPITGLSAFPYKQAEKLGYHKVDLISNHVYNEIGSEQEITDLLNAPIDWGWFQDERFFGSEGLVHLHSYFHLCKKFPPESVLDIAALLAVIRPRMRHLQKECQSLAEIKQRCWSKSEGPETEYFFKKSHSVAFAVLVVLNAQLIARRLEPKTYEPDGGFFI